MARCYVHPDQEERDCPCDHVFGWDTYDDGTRTARDFARARRLGEDEGVMP